MADLDEPQLPCIEATPMGPKETSLGSSQRLACVMVGLPARGKTYIARKISRYLMWLGYKTKVFNVGNYRRKNCGAQKDHSFFDPSNEEANLQRTQCAMTALDDMLNWFCVSGGCIAIYDATNSTAERREVINSECSKRGVSVMFIESICNDPEIILSNIREVKISSPDYVGIEPNIASTDFMQRIRHYEAAYETIDEQNNEKHLAFIKLIDVGSRVIMNLIKGYLQSRIVYYLMNLHITSRSIYLSRHGESLYNLAGKIGGDADLSPRGAAFGKSLPSFLKSLLPSKDFVVWTSTMKRTKQTATLLPYTQISWKALDELDSGVCDGMTYEEIAASFPSDFEERDKDKFNYRYKGGESYRDLVNRLEPIIMELERHNDPSPIFIIGHQAVLRAIYAYFMSFNHEELPYIKIPLHTVIELRPRAYGCGEERYMLNIPAVDTHRAKPALPVSPSSSTRLPSPIALANIFGVHAKEVPSPRASRNGETSYTHTSFHEHDPQMRIDSGVKTNSASPPSPVMVPYIERPERREDKWNLEGTRHQVSHLEISDASKPPHPTATPTGASVNDSSPSSSIMTTGLGTDHLEPIDPHACTVTKLGPRDKGRKVDTNPKERVDGKKEKGEVELFSPENESRTVFHELDSPR